MFEGFKARQIDVGETHIFARVGGKGPPLLLLHGYPQTHVMWHKIAPQLAERFTVVATDLRGYGESGKPGTDKEHFSYSKRSMAADQVKVMEALGFRQFQLVGHDRGARVAHRLCLDSADRVTKVSILDIVPTSVVFAQVDKRVATAYYHWFFLIQPYDLPETLIGANAEYYLRRTLGAWSANQFVTPEAFAAYLRAFRDPATIHATCEDYRAGASIDLEHHKQDAGRKIACPLQILWGSKGLVGRAYDPLKVWSEWADHVSGQAIDSGHFLPEEAPEATLEALMKFHSA